MEKVQSTFRKQFQSRLKWAIKPQEVVQVEKIREKLTFVRDTRNLSYIGYRLSDVLVIIIAAVLCGLDQLNEIVLYAQEREAFFAERFGIGRIPSKATFCRIMNAVKAEETAKAIIEFMKEEVGSFGDAIAFDGKAIRSTGPKGKPHSALQILTAYATGEGLVLAQEAINEKTNEIPVMQEMLDYIGVKGKTVTADAMHCQRETCAKITDAEHGGDYLFGLKENQKSLHDDVDLFFGDGVNDVDVETHSEIEKGHGRIERRICRKADAGWLSEHDWPGLKTVFSVRRVVESKHGVTDETAYYISSLDLEPSELLRISREHWRIESLHWMLDVDFSEDKCALLSENGQKNLNIFRKLALFAHRAYLRKSQKKISAKASLFKCLLNNQNLLEIIRSL
jgi:predicted transposase YbfD/YdcC